MRDCDEILTSRFEGYERRRRELKCRCRSNYGLWHRVMCVLLSDWIVQLMRET